MIAAGSKGPSAPVAAEIFNRDAAACRLKSSSTNFLNRARSASGKGADKMHPPKHDESRIGSQGNPDGSVFGSDALASPVNTQYLGCDPTRLIRSQKLHGVDDVIR